MRQYKRPFKGTEISKDLRCNRVEEAKRVYKLRQCYRLFHIFAKYNENVDILNIWILGR